MMKKKIKIILALSFTLNFVLLTFLFLYINKEKSRNNYFEFSKYKAENEQIKKEIFQKVIFLGNSIIENWIYIDSDFFISNRYICRGVGGQTSSQLLLRFQQDVVELAPHVVVINAGTNDIGQGDGFYNTDFTLTNLKSMVDIAKTNKIDVILTSVLPAEKYERSRLEVINNVQPIIDSLNEEIEKYAVDNNIPYVNYNKELRNETGGMKDNYSLDGGVHPNMEGYKVMEKLIKPYIDSLLTDNN